MASVREIKRRRGSVQSTQQITKAMKLVSTVKLQRARQRAEQAKAYFHGMYDTMHSILAQAGDIDSPYLKRETDGKIGIVVVTSNRGLAGGYNANLIRLVADRKEPKERLRLYTVGRKGQEAFLSGGYEMGEDASDTMDEPTYEAAKELSKVLLEDYRNGVISELHLAYTEFVNTVTHEPKMMKLLPFEKGESSKKILTPMNFEPREEEAFALLVPKYVASMLYGAFVESIASENGARLQAMESATQNAEEFMDELELQYNRARQGAITQELTEIIAGAGAIG